MKFAKMNLLFSNTNVLITMVSNSNVKLILIIIVVMIKNTNIVSKSLKLPAQTHLIVKAVIISPYNVEPLLVVLITI